MHAVYRPAGGGGGHGHKQPGGKDTEAALFPFHIEGAVDPHPRKSRITVSFAPHHRHSGGNKDNGHRGQQCTALARVTGTAPECKTECRRDQENRQHLHKVGQCGRVFKRMRRVGTEEAAAVGTKQFNCFLRCNRPHR